MDPFELAAAFLGASVCFCDEETIQGVLERT